jgi:hypothetical protein
MIAGLDPCVSQSAQRIANFGRISRMFAFLVSMSPSKRTNLAAFFVAATAFVSGVLVMNLTPSFCRADEIPAKAVPIRDWNSAGSTAFVAESRLYVQLAEVKKDEVLKLPRFIGVVKQVTWLNGSPAELSVQPEPDHWTVRLTTLPGDQTIATQQILVLQFDEPPKLFSNRTPVIADEEGILLLRAREGIVNGANLRFEPQPHKNTIGYWGNENDWAEWQFHVDNPGDYELEILQGCGKGHGGSTVTVETAGQSIRFEVQETGHFQNFVWKRLGKVSLTQSSDFALTVKCLKKVSGAVMDVRAIRLAPMNSKRSFQSELVAPEALPTQK